MNIYEIDSFQQTLSLSLSLSLSSEHNWWIRKATVVIAKVSKNMSKSAGKTLILSVNDISAAISNSI